jgi:hypothetical protein
MDESISTTTPHAAIRRPTKPFFGPYGSTGAYSGMRGSRRLAVQHILPIHFYDIKFKITNQLQ